MAFTVALTKKEGLAQLTELVRNYNKNRKTFIRPEYNETQLRNDFIDPFLMSFGWDVNNESRKTQFLRDVIQEESIEVEDSSSKKNPDYTLRVQGLRKLFVEAKKPSVNIIKSSKAAFQVRRYGWNANLGISLLISFDKLVIYDCRYKPDLKENAVVARIQIFNFSEYISAFEEIYDLISYESASSGRLDELFSVYERIGQTFDSYFLQQIERWRDKLAQSAIQRNIQLGNDEINFIVQRLLNRIIFLRICEDRTIEKYETLKKIENYDQLKSLFHQSDKKYNSGLFNFIEDSLSLNIELDSNVLIEIFTELYYPLSPYDFSVVDPSILSQIYETFLGSHVFLDEDRTWSIVYEPEVVASNGVVPTPKLIVEKIVGETLQPLVTEQSLDQLAALRIGDICCGSGTFLLSVYDFLLKSTIERLLEEGIHDPELIYESFDNTWALTLNAKRQVLENNIYGVDINPYAIEVAEFSLLLKLLEGESESSINHFISQYETKVLPSLSGNIKCGNSLVDNKFFNFMPEAIHDDKLLFRIKPFDWKVEFPFFSETGGFDAIVGNPPYVRIQNLVKFFPEEIKYYQSSFSAYTVTKKGTIDKYYVFIERAITLLREKGLLGYVIPNKLFITSGGTALRKFITTFTSFSKIIHFGVTQVFPNNSTYTVILILEKEHKEHFSFKRLKKITPELLASNDGYSQYKQQEFNEAPWIFLSKNTESLFTKIRSEKTIPLKQLSEILVGLQTSADKIYIFTPEKETDNTYIFIKDEATIEIEKDICVPCLYDLSFECFETVQGNAQMIFPYAIDGNTAEVIAEESFKKNYPLCWKYLNSHKVQLVKRSISGKDPKWYQFGRSQNLTRFHNSEKLIWPVLSTKPSYIFDTENIRFTGGGNGPYYSLINKSNYSIYYLMGILTHPIFECMVKAGASEFRGAYYSHGKQFIENIPIREIKQENLDEVELYNAIVMSVRNLIETKQTCNNSYGSNRTVLTRKIDRLHDSLIESINKLYEISDEEFNDVLNDEMFKNELLTEEAKELQ